MKKEEKRKEKKKLNIKIETLENKEINQNEEAIKFKKLSLEEIIPTLKENIEITNRRERRTNVEKEEEKPKETHVYDINKDIEKTGYHSIADYNPSGGNYDMFQKTGTAAMNSTQDFSQQQNQTRTYETSKEKEINERRKKDSW